MFDKESLCILVAIVAVVVLATGLSIFIDNSDKKQCVANLSANIQQWKRVAYGDQEIRYNRVGRKSFDVFAPGQSLPFRIWCECESQGICVVDR